MTKGNGRFTKRPPSDSYEVGYGKPPETTRFRPGQSGNPNGRPRGKKNTVPALHEERLKAIILEEAYRNIKVNEGERQITVPMAQAIVRSLAVSAAKGSPRSQKLFTDLLSTTEAANWKQYDKFVDDAIEYKLGWEAELKRREAFGIVAPDPIPHPDDIKINPRTGTIEIHGPASEQDLRKLRSLIARRKEFELELKDLEEMLKDPEAVSIINVLQNEIAHTKGIIALLTRGIDLLASKECVARIQRSPEPPKSSDFGDT
jgi:hypothetical protein